MSCIQFGHVIPDRTVQEVLRRLEQCNMSDPSKHSWAPHPRNTSLALFPSSDSDQQYCPRVLCGVSSVNKGARHRKAQKISRRQFVRFGVLQLSSKAVVTVKWRLRRAASQPQTSHALPSPLPLTHRTLSRLGTFHKVPPRSSPRRSPTLSTDCVIGHGQPSAVWIHAQTEGV